MPPRTEAVRSIRKAVASREPPDLESFCQYLERRVGYKLSGVVRSIFDHSATRTERRHLHRAGLLPPRDWRVLFDVVNAVALGMRTLEPENRVAVRLRCRQKALSARINRLLGVGWRSAVADGCWEATIERGIRIASGSHNPCSGQELAEAGE